MVPWNSASTLVSMALCRDRDGWSLIEHEEVGLAQPNIDVVLGADTVVLGALAALREAGKARADQFLGGIDGEKEAVVETMKGDSRYKASISLASYLPDDRRRAGPGQTR